MLYSAQMGKELEVVASLSPCAQITGNEFSQ